MKLVIATRNSKKLAEIKVLLKDLNAVILSLEDYPDIPEIVEDGNTFDENALKKASVTALYTKELTLADDSGLEVEFLNGRPGIFSSRFAHESATDNENNLKLLELLHSVPVEARTAAFVCSVAIVDVKNGKHYFARGRCEGYISDKIRGVQYKKVTPIKPTTASCLLCCYSTYF